MGGGVSQEALVKTVNDMVADIFVNIALYCNTIDVSTQTIDLTCTPFSVATSGSIYELNDKCQSCFTTIASNAKTYYTQQKALWENGEQVPGVNKPIDSDYQNVINNFVACAKQCKACPIENLSQKTLIKSVLDCAAFNNVKNSINQQLMESVTQKLTNNQDMLAPLAEMLGASTTNDVVYNITNRISAKLTDNVISNITQQISANQLIQITSDGPILATGQTEDSAFHSVQTYLSTTGIMNTIATTAQFKLLQVLYNDQNTINTLGNTVVKAVGYLSKLLTNVVGKVVFFVLILTAVLFLGIVLYVITNLIRKAVKKQKDNQMAATVRESHVSAFETF